MKTLWQNYIQNINGPTIRLFKHFLVSNHIYNEYRRNFMSQEAIKWRIKKKIQYCHNKTHLISEAFPWYTSPQGHDRWQSHSNLWRRWCFQADMNNWKNDFKSN